MAKWNYTAEQSIVKLRKVEACLMENMRNSHRYRWSLSLILRLDNQLAAPYNSV